MPTRPTKGDHGTGDRGSRTDGGAQKATTGSAVSGDVADAQREAAEAAAPGTGDDEKDKEADGLGRS